ncbi:MAG: Hsp20/alpha crystallin family protein [Planctomycetota bacterium]
MATTSPSVKSASAPSVRVTDPWSAMRQDMNELLGSFWGGTAPSKSINAAYVPALDVSEKENCFELHMDIPGLEAKDLDIQVHGNTVTVSGHRKEESEQKDKTYHRIERRSGSFSRTVTLPCEVAVKEVAAEYTNGVLNVVLPKCEKSRPAKISVKG